MRLLYFVAPVCFANTNCGKESAIGDLSLAFHQCCFGLSGAAYALPRQCLPCPKTGKLTTHICSIPTFLNQLQD